MPIRSSVNFAQGGIPISVHLDQSCKSYHITAALRLIIQLFVVICLFIVYVITPLSQNPKQIYLRQIYKKKVAKITTQGEFGEKQLPKATIFLLVFVISVQILGFLISKPGTKNTHIRNYPHPGNYFQSSKQISLLNPTVTQDTFPKKMSTLLITPTTSKIFFALYLRKILAIQACCSLLRAVTQGYIISEYDQILMIVCHHFVIKDIFVSFLFLSRETAFPNGSVRQSVSLSVTHFHKFVTYTLVTLYISSKLTQLAILLIFA